MARWTIQQVAQLGRDRIKDMAQPKPKGYNLLEDREKYVKLRIDYRGEALGLNEYKSMNREELSAKYNKVKDELFGAIYRMNPPRMQWFEVRVYHNRKFDVDNLAGIVKPFVDALRELKIVPEDDKRYWDFMSIQYANQVEKGSIVFEITGEKLIA